jgi:hypothetical protein
VPECQKSSGKHVASGALENGAQALSERSQPAVVGFRTGGAQLTARPAWPGSDITMRDLDPLTGARAARDIELAARHAARDYIRQAREAGHDWDQIGQALAVTPDADADQTGPAVAEAAYTYAAGSPYTDAAVRHGRSFVWRCQSCDQAISDRGLIAGPADDEVGHAGNCARLAAATAEWNAGWEAGL